MTATKRILEDKIVNHENHTTNNGSTTEEVALNAFFNLAEKWSLSSEQQITLLGEPARSTFFKWKKSGVKKIPKDTLERISHLLSIHKCLGILIKEQEAKYSWLYQENSGSTFKGAKPIDIMLDGKMIDLLTVRQYLDVQRGA